MKSDVMIYFVLIFSPGCDSAWVDKGRVPGPCKGNGKDFVKGKHGEVRWQGKANYSKFYGDYGKDTGKGKVECAVKAEGCTGYGQNYTPVCKNCHWLSHGATAHAEGQVYQPKLGSGGQGAHMRRKERRIAEGKSDVSLKRREVAAHVAAKWAEGVFVNAEEMKRLEKQLAVCESIMREREHGQVSDDVVAGFEFFRDQREKQHYAMVQETLLIAIILSILIIGIIIIAIIIFIVSNRSLAP